MAHALVRFHDELSDFLRPEQRGQDLMLDFAPPCPLRHLIERCGVPHTEVGPILVNGEHADLDRRLGDGDRVVVYPPLRTLDVRRARAPSGWWSWGEPRFIADAHLGRLARHLRLLGFDTLFANDPGDAALAATAGAQRRILLTRDRGLLMRREVSCGCLVRSGAPLEQLAQVLGRWDLGPRVRPFTRCTLCNGLLRLTPRAEVSSRLPPAVLARQDRFWRCAGCGRVYWQGSHYHRLRELVAEILQGPTECR